MIHEWLSVTEAAERRGMSRDAIIRGVRSGLLKSEQVSEGGAYLIRADSLESWSPRGGGRPRVRGADGKLLLLARRRRAQLREKKASERAKKAAERAFELGSQPFDQTRAEFAGVFNDEAAELVANALGLGEEESGLRSKEGETVTDRAQLVQIELNKAYLGQNRPESE